MAGGVAAESILFIGAVIAATAFGAVMAAVGGTMAQDVRAQGDMVSTESRSAFRIINDPEQMASPTPVIYVKNTGSTTLMASELELILNGAISESLSFDVLGSTDDETWPPGKVLAITVNDLSANGGDHRVKVITGSGVSATFAWSG